MWKKLIGKDKTPQEIEAIKKEAESGRHKIYPILKPANWAGIKAGALKQTFIGSKENPQIVIGYGYNTPENFVFLTHQHLKKMDGNKIIKDAYQNLADYQVAFKYTKEQNKKMLIASDTDFSSEKILSVKHMLKAHDMLNAENILVVIPRRRCMLAIAKNAEKEVIDTFVKIHQNIWQDNNHKNAPITSLIFELNRGNIVQYF